MRDKLVQRESLECPAVLDEILAWPRGQCVLASAYLVVVMAGFVVQEAAALVRITVNSNLS